MRRSTESAGSAPRKSVPDKGVLSRIRTTPLEAVTAILPLQLLETLTFLNSPQWHDVCVLQTSNSENISKRGHTKMQEANIETTILTDPQLVELSRNGDTEAFGKLI